MTDRVMIDWHVPTPEWERFRDHVHDEHGSIRGHLGAMAETAMIEYAGLDDVASVESKIHKLVQAAGRRPFKEKNSTSGGAFATSNTTRVTAKVKPEVKAGFREAMRETENNPGVDFARAIRQYREQPRAERMDDELDRILDDAERLLGELRDADTDEDTDGDATDSLSLAERKTIAICDDLGETFTDAELVDTIERVAEVSSEPSIEKYRGLVTDRLGMERHPTEPHLWISHEAADEIAGGEPRVTRQPTARLDRDEKVRRIQLAVGRAAGERNSREVRVETPAIQEDVLDGDVSRASTLSLMRAAEVSPGITVDNEVSPAAIEVDLQMLAQVDVDLVDAIVEYRRSDVEGLLSGPTSSTLGDHVSSPGAVASANESAFADGGTKSRSKGWLGSPGYDGDGDADGGGGDGE